LVLLALAICPLAARADVGLIVEGPTGKGGFLVDLGHSAVWISRACLDPQGRLYYCDGGSGVVVSSASYWLADGAAAIPAEDYFLGPGNNSHAAERAQWNRNLAPIYPTLASDNGAKFIGRVWGRQERVDVFPTTPEQDRAAIAQVETLREHYRFTPIRQNCANFSLDVLRFWVGDSLKVRRWADAGAVTPVGLEHGLLNALGKAPHGPVVIYRFPPPRSWIDRRPALDGCSVLLFDPKYAAALLVVEPFAYVGAAGCYAWIRVQDHLHSRHTTLAEGRHPFHRRRETTPKEVFAAFTQPDAPPSLIPAATVSSDAPEDPASLVPNW
jgi:hypothetical protein